MNKDEEDITFEPETDGDQAAPQKDLAIKVKKLKEELAACKKEKQEYLDGWQRLQADTINTKKRDTEERRQFAKFAKEDLIMELIQVLTSFDMAFQNKPAWEKVDPNWRSGVEYISKQFRQILEDNGLSEINPLGEEFDPARDEAVEHVIVEGKENHNKVVEVVQKGYKLHDKIVRPPRVKVGEFKEEK